MGTPLLYGNRKRNRTNETQFVRIGHKFAYFHVVGTYLASIDFYSISISKI